MPAPRPAACHPAPAGRRDRRPLRRGLGLTLLELAVALAVLALLVSMAVPSMASALQRHRLLAAAAHLAADVAEARHEAARSGLAVHLQPQAGADWCWSVARNPGCDCRLQQPCALRHSLARDHRGVDLLAAAPTRLDPQGMAQPAQLALLRAGDLALRVDVPAMGRARVCSLDAPVAGVPPC